MVSYNSTAIFQPSSWQDYGSSCGNIMIPPTAILSAYLVPRDSFAIFTPCKARSFRNKCRWGKVRLRGKPKEGCYWRDYKAVRLQEIYYGAFFDENQSLIDYVNSQSLVNPLFCLGDGHDGVWNLVQEFGCEQLDCVEILDWFQQDRKSL